MAAPDRTVLRRRLGALVFIATPVTLFSTLGAALSPPLWLVALLVVGTAGFLAALVLLRGDLRRVLLAVVLAGLFGLVPALSILATNAPDAPFEALRLFVMVTLLFGMFFAIAAVLFPQPGAASR